MYDVIVIGGGPAGMTVALYAVRNGKSALVIERGTFGGQITHSPKVENYPGTLSMSGNEFADKTLEQILAQGAEIEIDTVTGVRDEGARKVVVTETGEFEGKTVVIATGVKHRMLGLPGEDELVGEGISFCAVCDGDFYAGKTVCVAGGGNSALQEAILLSEKCARVIMLQDLPDFTGEPKLREVLFARPNVEKHVSVSIDRLLTENGELTGVGITHKATGETEEIKCDGLFVAIGLIPENEPYRDLCDLNNYGYFDSDERCLTKTPGVFVAGDCRSKAIRQVATAISDGAVAALAACRYVDGI
ncbi:MAG: FAD-dependent oxidoreductase [Clostridia bacterium]|nr:FAD-dependent oxidoreductase [Clostridia bacterium]MBR7032772.1 FAD-dependent oxidoreductase [Clostridia bacterium]